MCVGLPGQVVDVRSDPGPLMGRVRFAGSVRDVCLMYLPEVDVGDHVIVHMGFAVERIDAATARELEDSLRRVTLAPASGDTAASGAGSR